MSNDEARPLSAWHEDDGPVLWWAFHVQEAPYVGSPLDLGQTVEVHTHAGMVSRFQVGGWPGYHTHWTPLPPTPLPPTKMRRKLVSMQRKGGERTRTKLAGKDVLIWSSEHHAWWRPDRSGYTTFRSAAGRYSFEDAWEATSGCGPEKKITFEVLS